MLEVQSVERWLLSLGEVLGFCIQYHGFVIGIANIIASTLYIRSCDTEVPELTVKCFQGLCVSNTDCILASINPLSSRLVDNATSRGKVRRHGLYQSSRNRHRPLTELQRGMKATHHSKLTLPCF